MKRKIVLTTLIVLVLAFTMGAAGARPAQAATASQISAGWMPFAGSVYDLQTDSSIHLNGLVHIVSHWDYVSDSEVQVSIDTNLPAGSVTVTTDTGIPYSASGAGQSSISIPNDPVLPPSPIRLGVQSFVLTTVGSDRLLPPSPILPPNPILPPSPIRPFTFGMRFNLVFDAAGVLDFNASRVQVIALDIDGG